MKFPDALSRGSIPRSMILQEVFGLVLEMFKAGIIGETSDRHANFVS
jgi:hypothetical protein